jgi:hypothetical protein
MYFVEFYTPKPTTDLEEFRKFNLDAFQKWQTEQPSDRPTLAIARTWRLGGPHYIVVWEIDSAARIDEWTQIRKADAAADKRINDWMQMVDCDCGLYEDMGQEQL